ncbi:hypothetical protein AKJ52_02830 [candidate division MSBL1 archaeon SCGC-AAA382C18]|uniref:Uncharacterized protein n=1 Tax=candidate division MSBL1 archaeon SCGC-AAA382C18 TaxID=1698281 RepID=A0A133VHL2_9EURY|nr:hypothetical protein AKJ52_02830 [candidate division MSBL1 archaeon SCGC-AAA382C18]
MKKTLKISEGTHRRLKQLGRKGETFDDIIKKLLPPEDSDSRKERMEKLEDLGKIAREKKRKEIETGKLEKTDSGWRVNLGEA